MEIGGIKQVQAAHTVIEQSKTETSKTKQTQSIVVEQSSTSVNQLKNTLEMQQGEFQQEKEAQNKEKQLLDLIEKSGGKFETHNNQLSFAMHEATKQVMVKVIDKATQEVIREIPSKKVLDIVADRMEAAGLFVDKRR